MKVVIIGSGNVANHLGEALQNAGHKIIQVYNRSGLPAKNLAKRLHCPFTTTINEINKNGDIYLIALRDEAISAFAGKMTKTSKLVVHTSGSVPLKVLAKKFKNCGVLYPVQSFSPSHRIIFKKVPVCIEASNSLFQKKLHSLAESVSENVHVITSKQRKTIHLAAVFANNFSNHLFEIAENIIEEKNISFDLLRPLILQTAMKVQKNLPGEMQTGPAKRGDSSIVNEHLNMLLKKKRFHEIYKLMSDSIRESQGILM